MDASFGSFSEEQTRNRLSKNQMTKNTQFPSTVTVKSFVSRSGIGETHYSIRRRGDGLFQVYHDDIYDGINEPHEGHDEQWGGLFDTVEAAEKELLRLRPSLEATVTSAAVRGPDRQ